MTFAWEITGGIAVGRHQDPDEELLSVVQHWSAHWSGVSHKLTEENMLEVRCDLEETAPGSIPPTLQRWIH